MSRRYSYIVFDLDGTLMDTYPGVVYGVTQMAQQLGLRSLSEDELRSMPKGQLLIRIAKKTGIMKEENRQKKRKRSAKRKNNKKKKKNIGKEKRENRENREETDDYWLDE